MSNKPPPPRPGMSVPSEIAENAEAKREYLRVIKLLDGKLDERDRSLLCDYAMTHAEIIELRIAVDHEGRTLEGPKGGMYINPTVNLLTSRQTHLAQLRRDMYFTPKSRIEKQKKAALSKAQSIRADILRDQPDNDDQD